jgi:hypothetical protein
MSPDTISAVGGRIAFAARFEPPPESHERAQRTERCEGMERELRRRDRLRVRIADSDAPEADREPGVGIVELA